MPKQSFIDLEEAVEQWAWKMYDLNARSRKQRQLRDKMLKKKEPTIGVNIDWSRVSCVDHTTWAPLADDDFADDNSNSGVANGEAKVNGVVEMARSAHVDTPDVNILFNTEFTNDTGKDQVYTLRIDKKTCSLCSTEVEHGVTKGVELGVSLKLPSEVFEANAGFKREVSLTKVEGETIEEEASWGAESTITVAEGKVAKAKLIVREKKQLGNFQVQTKLRGTAWVSFTNRSDNNSQLFSQSGKIDFIIKDFLADKQKVNHTYEFVQVQDGTVTITTKGKCRFRYGVKQEVAVVQENINRSLSPVRK